MQQPPMNRARRSFTLQWLKVINVCKLSSCLSWPMKLEKIASKEHEKKPCPELPEWCSPSQRETKHSPPHLNLCYNSSLSRKRWKNEGMLHCDQYALHMSDCSRCLSTWLMFLFFNGIWFFFHTSIYLAFILRGFICVYSMSVHSLPGHPFTAQVIDRLLCETRLNNDLKHNSKPPWQMSNASHIITTI